MLELLAQGSPDTIQSLGEATNWIDLVAIAVIIVTIIHGVVRGFMLQLMGVLVLIGSLALASALGTGLGDWLGMHVFKSIPQETAHTVGFAILFVVGLGLGRALTYLLRDHLERVKLLPYDRFFGAVMGALKGAVVVIVILTLLVAFLHQDQAGKPPSGITQDVLRSRSFYVTNWAKKHLLVFLPENISNWVDRHFPELALDRSQSESATVFT
jgi:membrane protein required for colicin V production